MLFARYLALVNETAREWAGLPKTVRLLVAARAVNRLGAFTLPFLTLRLTQNGASLGTAGLLFGLFGLATIPSRLAGGELGERVGRKPTIVAGLLLTALAQFMIAAWSALLVDGAAVILLGLAFEIYEAPTQAFLADEVPTQVHATAYNLLGAGLAAAGVVSGLLASAIAVFGIRFLFLADGLTCIACALLVGQALPKQTSHQARQVEGVAQGSALRDRSLVLLTAVGTCFAVIYFQIAAILPVTVLRRGLDPSEVGLLLALSGMTIVVGQPLLRIRLVEERDPFFVLAVGYAILGCGLAGYAEARTLAQFSLATIVWSLGDLLLLGLTYALVAQISPEVARARYMAIYGLSWGVAAVIGPLLGTQLVTRAGLLSAWLSAAALAVLLAALQPIIRRTIRSSERSTG